MSLTQAEKDEFFQLLCKMSVLDAAEIKARVNEELDVSFDISTESPMLESTPAAYACQTWGRMGGEAPEPYYNLTLAKPGVQRIAVMRLVRDLLELGIAESKKFIDSTPQVVLSEVSQTEAEELQAAFDNLGAESIIEYS